MELSLETHKVFCKIVGQGRPVLVMHGGLGLDHTYLRSGLNPLGHWVQIVYYDLFGHGRSARPKDFGTVTYDTWVEEADALRAKLGHKRVVLFGHSYGGFLALEYALKYGKRVDGLVLVCTAAILDYAETAMKIASERATPEQMGAIIQLFEALVPDDEDLRHLWNIALPVYMVSREPSDRELLKTVRFSAGSSNRSLGELIASYNVSGRLSEIAAPALVVAGAHDWVAPPALAAEPLHAGLPDSQMVVMEKSGHFPFIQEGETFRERVSAWVEGLA